MHVKLNGKRTSPYWRAATIWAALLATSAAQLELKREPLPEVRPNAPAGEAIPLPAKRVERVIINNGVIVNGVVMEGAGGLLVIGPSGQESVKTEPDPAGPHILEFADGRRLHGTLAALEANRSEIVWKRADSPVPLRIPLADVVRWSSEAFNASKPAPPKSSPAATIKFLGGDWLVANAVELKEDKLQLQLPGGVAFAAQRSQVEWVHFSPSSASETYDGPTSLDGWTSAGGWTYRDGALWSNSPSAVTRSFDALADRMEYSFVIDQGTDVRSFSVSLHNRSRLVLGKDRVGMMQLSLRGQTLNLWARMGANTKSVQTELRDRAAEAARQSGPLSMRILEDTTDGRILVYLNDRPAAQWTIDKSERGSNGGNFQLQPTTWNGDKQQSISAIKILPWDGVAPEDRLDREMDAASLRNGNQMHGKVVGLDTKSLQMKVEKAGTEVPFEDVEMLRFARPSNLEDDAPTVARVRLASKGEFDLVSLDWRDNQFRARTNFGGEVALPPSSIVDLAFQRPPAKPRAGTSDILVFRNDDRLPGSIESVAEDGTLRWKPNPAGPPINFAATNVLGLQLNPPAGEPAGALKSKLAVRFRNGDWMRGELIKLDAETLTFEAQGIGQVNIPRSTLKALYVLSGESSDTLSDGVADHGLWERGIDMSPANASAQKKLAESANPWSYFGGTYKRAKAGVDEAAYARVGGIQLGRHFEKLPQKVDFSFKVSSERMPPYFTARLFTEPSNPGYMVHVSTAMISFYDMSPQKGARGITPQQFKFGQDANPRPKVRYFRILADRISGRAFLLMDGVVVGRVAIRANDGPRNLGRGFMISPPPNLETTYSDLWVGPWDGNPPTEKASPSSTVALANGDDVQGTIESATATSLKIASDLGPLELPFDRISLVDFGGDLTTPPAAGGARIFLAGQGSITVDRWALENQTIACRHPILGDLKLPLNAIREITLLQK